MVTNGDGKMNNDMKCPICQQKLLLSSLRDSDEEHQMWTCLSCQLSAQQKIWEALINERQHTTDCQDLFIEAIAQKLEIETKLERTRKALDIAVDGLEKMTWGCDSSDAEHLLKEIKEITSLEQKDVK